MPPLYVLKLASQSIDWLSRQQSIIATNVANASTPGFREKELAPFASFVDSGNIQFAATNAAHLVTPDVSSSTQKVMESSPAEETLSGNSVNIERQMTRLGEVNRAHSLNVNIARVFHQMLLSGLK